ncbi:hypothetical protein CYY_007481 [Polysphondylium violaceum]|uniref:Uncharacterized protein n=1 Tax=Polysphondylium violaceum TaxID=133409 RepID=A0A8J4PQW8_9MYCE|nr:hypothetical protein CYY_007481 [Polysphondylium violaceum]
MKIILNQKCKDTSISIYRIFTRLSNKFPNHQRNRIKQNTKYAFQQNRFLLDLGSFNQSYIDDLNKKSIRLYKCLSYISDRPKIFNQLFPPSSQHYDIKQFDDLLKQQDHQFNDKENENRNN